MATSIPPQLLYILKFLKLQNFPSVGGKAGADQGFSVGGGADLLGVGAPKYDYAKFSKKTLHKIENILGLRGLIPVWKNEYPISLFSLCHGNPVLYNLSVP